MKPDQLTYDRALDMKLVEFLPPRRPTGDPQNKTRGVVAALINRLVDLYNRTNKAGPAAPMIAAIVLLQLAGVELDRGDGVQGAWVQAVGAAIAAVFGWLADKAVTVALVVWHAVQIAGVAIWNFAKQIGGVFVKLYDLLGKFWRDVLKPVVSFIWRNIDRIHDWLKRTLGPVITFLEKVRARVWEIYDRYFKPVLDTIELARRVTQILAALHVKWAAELDRKLAELEDRLLWPVREAMMRINQLIAWTDRVIDMNGLYSRGILIRSMWRDIEAQWKMLNNAQSKPLTDAEKEQARTRVEWPTTEQNMQQFEGTLRAHDGPRSSAIEEQLADMQLRLRGVL